MKWNRNDWGWGWKLFSTLVFNCTIILYRRCCPNLLYKKFFLLSFLYINLPCPFSISLFQNSMRNIKSPCQWILNCIDAADDLLINVHCAWNCSKRNRCIYLCIKSSASQMDDFVALFTPAIHVCPGAMSLIAGHYCYTCLKLQIIWPANRPKLHSCQNAAQEHTERKKKVSHFGKWEG